MLQAISLHAEKADHVCGRPMVRAVQRPLFVRMASLSLRRSWRTNLVGGCGESGWGQGPASETRLVSREFQRMGKVQLQSNWPWLLRQVVMMSSCCRVLGTSAHMLAHGDVQGESYASGKQHRRDAGYAAMAN